jgi:hypothetical protein
MFWMIPHVLRRSDGFCFLWRSDLRPGRLRDLEVEESLPSVRSIGLSFFSAFRLTVGCCFPCRTVYVTNSVFP